MRKHATRFFLLILAFVVTPFFACDDGGSSSSKDLPLDSRLVGQSENSSFENDDDTYYSLITITSKNVFTNILVYPHDSSDFDEKFWGRIDSGERGTISTSGTDMTITLNQNWESAEYSWVAKDPVDKREAAYELSSDGNTLTVTLDEGSLHFTRGTAPAPDSNLTGTWEAQDFEDLDDDSGTLDQEVTLTATIASNGSYTIEKIETATSGFLESEAGTCGVYRDIEGDKYFVKVLNTESSSTKPTASVYYYQRMEYLLSMFDDPDRFIIDPDGNALTFYRQGADPGVPDPDAALIGYWQGIDDEGGTDYDLIIRFDADNSVERVLLHQLTDTEHPGEMYAGGRGQFMGDDGEFISYFDQEWQSSDGSWASMDDYFDSAYFVESGVLSIVSSSGAQTLDSIPAPAASSDFVGTWVLVTTENWDETGGDDAVRYTLTVDASCNMTLTYEDIDGAPFIYGYQTGTCGVSTIDTVDCLTIVIEYSDEGTEVSPLTLPIASPTESYRMSRYDYEFNTGMTEFTLHGGMTFTKVP